MFTVLQVYFFYPETAGRSLEEIDGKCMSFASSASCLKGSFTLIHHVCSL